VSKHGELLFLLIDWWGMIPASNLSSGRVLIWFGNHCQFTLFFIQGEIGRHVGDNHAFVFCRAYGSWRTVSVRMQHSFIFKET
jgi:hypothetical protein